MSHRIIVTTDFSSEARRAYAPAAELARRLGASVTLLHVVEEVAVIPHGAPLAGPLVSPQVGGDIAAAKRSIAEEAQQFPGGAATAVETSNDVAVTVATFAEKHDVELIALASHGRSGLRRLIMGSVAERILRHATRPVLVYPPAQQPAH